MEKTKSALQHYKCRERWCDMPRPPHEQVAGTAGDLELCFPFPGGRDSRRSWSSVSCSSRGTSGSCRAQVAGDFWGPGSQRAMQKRTELLGRALAELCLCSPGAERSMQRCFQSSSTAQTAHHWPWRGMRALSDLLGGRETSQRLSKEH